jgi:hypothetical protein
MSQSRIFLDALFSAKTEDLYILIWTLLGDKKRSCWFRDVQQAAAYVDSLRGCNVYVGIGLSPSDFGEFNRCKSEDVSGVIGIGVDIDLRSDAHSKGARPESIEQALSILPPEFPPSIIVETGNGIQVWWLFKEPWIFDSAEERQRAATLLLRWQTLLRYDAQHNGWVFERLGDLARVLRVPGTENVKDPANPKNVVIRTSTDQRYNPSDFSDFLDDLAIPSEDEQTQAAKEWVDQFSDKPLVISMAAAIPDEMLMRWLEQDSRFAMTWNHQRDNMSDESQSGYDLALANFGAGKGLTGQQIVDLIIHNRRLHGAKQRKSLDYYQRAISKARCGAGKCLPVGEVAACGTGNLVPSSGTAVSAYEGPPDPNEKAKICDRLSAIFGVQILRIEKLNGSEPVYLMELESGCIEFPAVGKLLSQKFVREALAAKTGKLIQTFRKREWEQLAQLMLDACIEKEGTDDLEFKGAARINISKYLSDNPPVAGLERLTGPNVYSPLIDDGRIVISSTDLQIYITRTAMQNISVKRVAAMISSIGGDSVRIRRNSFREQSRWALPVAEWNPKDYTTGVAEPSDAQ